MLPDDESEDSTPPSSPPAPISRRSKFEDEEDSDEVLESLDAAEDSDVEREKAAKAAEAKAKAETEAKAAHKPKTQRIQENIQRRKEQAAEEEESSDEEEDESERRSRMRKSEKDSDLKHAEDLFGDVDLNRKRTAPKPAAVVASTTTANKNDTTANTVDLGSLPLFNPSTKDQFTLLRDTLAPILAANAKKPQYSLFLTEFAKQLAKDLPSDQIKKMASGLTTLSNEKMKEEKAADKGGKKTKAAKTKASLVATRDVSTRADTAAYDDGFEE